MKLLAKLLGVAEVNKRELIKAIRRDRQMADFFGLPAEIRQAGTFGRVLQCISLLLAGCMSELGPPEATSSGGWLPRPDGGAVPGSAFSILKCTLGAGNVNATLLMTR